MIALQCHACGARFWSMSAEAKHRHNFPALCNKRSKAWARFQAEICEREADKDQEEVIE